MWNTKVPRGPKVQKLRQGYHLDGHLSIANVARPLPKPRNTVKRCLARLDATHFGAFCGFVLPFLVFLARLCASSFEFNSTGLQHRVTGGGEVPANPGVPCEFECSLGSLLDRPWVRS